MKSLLGHLGFLSILIQNNKNFLNPFKNSRLQNLWRLKWIRNGPLRSPNSYKQAEDHQREAAQGPGQDNGGRQICLGMCFY